MKCDECLQDFDYPLREVKDVKGNPVSLCRNCNSELTRQAMQFVKAFLKILMG